MVLRREAGSPEPALQAEFTASRAWGDTGGAEGAEGADVTRHSWLSSAQASLPGSAIS